MDFEWTRNTLILEYLSVGRRRSLIPYYESYLRLHCFTVVR